MKQTFTRTFCLFRWLAVLGLGLCTRQALAQSSQGAVDDATEVQALRQLYEATNGSQWVAHTNWPTTPQAWTQATLTSAASWYGVSVQNGDVTSLSLSDNQLTGTIPPSLGQLRGLSQLSLYNNQLTGPIPAAVGQLSGLKSLNLFNNQLSGPLPATIGQLGSLLYLNLFANQLSGALPATLGQLTQVRDVNLFNNQFSGSVPAEFSQLRNLQYLNLNDNHLSGSVQPALGALNPLQHLRLQNNNFSFADLDPLFTGPGQSIRASLLQYAPQFSPAGEVSITVATGQPLHLLTSLGGAHSRYQWQRQQRTGTWQDLPGATAAAYQVASVGVGDAGRYRCVATDEWVANLTLYSQTTVVQLGDTLPPDNPDPNTDHNWTFERSYDGNGNVVAESKQFTDGLGRPTQAQARNAVTQQVFAAQTIYSTGGQPVLQTLAAPTNNQSFNYKEDFITAPSGGTSVPYGPTHFEQANASAPTPVDATSVGTLGYYYSKLNAQEPLTPATSYPYSLVEMYDGPMGGTKRAAAPGDELRMGRGREATGRDFLVRKEFDQYLALRPQFVPGSPSTTLEYQALKSVSVNADGRESITVMNKEGQALISCLSGVQYPGLPVYGYISADGPGNGHDDGAPVYADVHIPAAGSQDVKFTMDKNSPADQNQVAGSVRIVNLLTDEITDYSLSVTNVGITQPELHVTLAPGFYRFVSLRGTQWTHYEVHYGDFSYSYYDDAGRLMASIAPKGLAGLPASSSLTGAGSTTVPTAVYRLHAGGDALATSRGQFAADQYYDPAPGTTSATTDNIAGTADPDLYKAERFAPDLHYKLPVTRGQAYTVILHFAEIYWREAGKRVFDVAIDGALVLRHYDIFQKVGFNTATTETFTVTATADLLDIFLSSRGPGGADLAKISAIEVLTTGPVTPPSPSTGVSTAVYRLKVGGALTTSRGQFAADQYYDPAPGTTSATTDNIAGTADPDLYKAERFAPDLHYKLPVTRGQAYTVILHFAEIYWREAGKRVFDVAIDGALVLRHYDIFQKVGFNTATTETFTVTATADLLDIFLSSRGPGGADLAKISAIEVLTAGPTPTGGPSFTPSFVTRNTYDTKGQLLTTESGDEGRSEYVYALDGRIRFSQSALQRLSGRFSYSNYDEAGRVVESGEYTPGGATFENHLTTTPAATSVLQPSLLEDRTRAGGLLGTNCAQRNQVWYDLAFDGTAGSQGDDRQQLGSRHQEFVVGAVAKTQNDQVTTWYSYDELGRVTWVVQDIAGVGVKTLDYQYDFSGNVLQVAYQQGQPDSFTHYYGYDAAQRLTSVYTSPDGTARTLQAQYTYYLHGPLKRVQVAGNLQGVDYVYTLQGALKSINHATSALEPGRDAPATNGVYKDLFALTLEYFSGDYRSGGIDVPAPPLPPVVGPPVADRFDGTIRSASWRTAASPDIQRMAYTYDEKSQLQNSTYSNWQLINKAYQLNTGSTSRFQEGGLNYDPNGNIQSLRRTGATGAVTDDFSYKYKANTNQLAEVHTGSASGATVLDYDYDELGQMTRQRDEQGQRYFTYDVTGKTTGVYLDANHQQPVVTFAYDDRGFRVSKTAYPTGGAPAATTTYVRDVAGNILAIYTQAAPNGPWQRTEVPLYGASRLGTLTHLSDNGASGRDDYRYELSDHLGNARVVFHRPTTTTDVETMELGGVPSRAAFLNDDRYRVPATNAPSGDYVARLTDTQAPGQELKRVLAVTRGDTVTFSALGQWKQQAAGAGSAPYVLLGAAAGVNALSQRGADGQTTYGTNNTNWLSLLAAGLGFTIGQGAPASLGATSLEGWIKYRVLDAQGNPMLDAQGQELKGIDYLLGTGQWEYLQTGVRVPQDGTLELVAGTSGTGEAVYFDNLRVEQTGSLIVQEQHQYAFGAPLPGLSYTIGNKRYRYGYQGQYAEHDDETGFESFELRLYNSRVGRWLSTDPEGQYDSPYVGMGNNTVLGVDPTGGWGGPGPFYTLGNITKGAHALGEVTVTASRGLSTGARIGLQAASSLGRTVKNGLPSVYNRPPGGQDFVVRDIQKRQNEIVNYNTHYNPAFMPGGKYYAGDDIQPSYLLEDIFIGGIFFKGALGVARGLAGPKIAADFGEIIGWGEGQSTEAIEQTIRTTENLTRRQISQMARRGLTKDWVQSQLVKYEKAIATGGKKIANNGQLLPRKELMEKILGLWK